MDEISLTIDRLTLTGIPVSDRDRFVALLDAELRRALVDRYADLPLDAPLPELPDAGALQQLVRDVVRRVVQSEIGQSQSPIGTTPGG